MKILSGEKSIETRSYPLPKEFQGKLPSFKESTKIQHSLSKPFNMLALALSGRKVLLIASSGQEGVSHVPDSVPEGLEGLAAVSRLTAYSITHMRRFCG